MELRGVKRSYRFAQGVNGRYYNESKGQSTVKSKRLLTPINYMKLTPTRVILNNEPPEVISSGGFEKIITKRNQFRLYPTPG